MEYFLKQTYPCNLNPALIIPLTEDEFIFGTRNMLPYIFPQLSERHAKFYKTEDGSLFIKKLSSLYGLSVNGIKIGSSLKKLKMGDIIGFGVKTPEENGLICTLGCKPIEPELIELSDDDGMPETVKGSVKSGNSRYWDHNSSDDIQGNTAISKDELLIDESYANFEQTTAKPSTSGEHNFIDRNYHNILTKKLFIPLIRCDSEYFVRPPDVENPSSVESSDDDVSVLRYLKKRCRRISSDSSVKSDEDNFFNLSPKISSNAPVTKTKNKHKQTNICKDINITSSDSQSFLHSSTTKNPLRKHSSDGTKLMSHRNKRARLIIPEFSDASDESSHSTTYENKNSFLKQRKDKNNPLSNCKTPQDFSSSDNTRNKVVLNENVSTSNEMFPESSSFVENVNVNFDFNLSNNSKKESRNIAESFTAIECNQGENSLHDSFDGTDTYSQNDGIIEASNDNDDDYFNFEGVQSFSHIRTEPEDDEDFENNTIYEGIFGRSDESEDLSYNLKNKYLEPEDQKMETVEAVEKFVNFSAQRDLSVLESGGSEKLDCKRSDSESEESSNEEVYLSSVKYSNLENTKPESKKSFRKTLLTDPKPLPYRPRKMRGRDEGYVERRKSINLQPKRRRWRAKKSEQIRNAANNRDSSVRPIIKHSTTSRESSNDLNNLKTKLLPVQKELLQEDNATFENPCSSKRNDIKSACKILLTDTKPTQYGLTEQKTKNEEYVERPKLLDPIAERNEITQKCSLVEHEVCSPDSEVQSSGKNHIAKEKKSIDDNYKNKNFPNSNAFQSTRKNISSVKVRPDKFSSRMGFLTNKEVINPIRRNKISAGNKKQKDNTNNKKIQNSSKGEKSGASSFGSKLEPSSFVENKVVQEVVVPGKVPQTNLMENKHPKPSGSNSSHSLHIENPQSQNVSHISADASNRISVPGEDRNLTNKEVINPIRNKISAGNKKQKDNTNNKKIQNSSKGEKSGASSFGSKLEPSSFVENKVVQELVVPGKVPQTNLMENKHPKPSGSNPSHSLHIENPQSQNASHISADASNRISVPGEDRNLLFDFSSEDEYIVKTLIRHQAIWLQEQRKMPNPPPDVLQNVAPLPLCFTSYESYVSSFYPLVRLDIWQHMFEQSKNVFFTKKTCNRFSFRVLSCVSKHDCMELRCESVLNEKFYFEPREGMITILTMEEVSSKRISLFGFIQKHEIQLLNLDVLHPCWKKFPEYLRDAKRYIFTVLIKRKELLLDSDILMQGNGICYIRSRLRLVDALRNFKNSPLLTDIIEPKMATLALSCSKSSSRKYSPRQMEIIQAICSEVNKSYIESKISLLYGPPGTGKTHIIVGMLETLFYTRKSHANLKVLVTAPSNIALDEIGCRLVDLNEKYNSKDHRVKFVRIGPKKQVHLKMLPHFIDQKASELHMKTVRSEDHVSLKKMHYRKEIEYKCQILKESHIVLSTLSSCSLSLLSNKKSGLKFSCCIVDESTQCTELEILQPLALGIDKLVLVGDEKQLPAAHSEYSKKYGFDRSMFERFCLYFKSKNQPSPVLTLTEQFRMHPEICQFPSVYMYNEKLDTHPDTILHNEFPLKPYLVLDIPQCNDSEIFRNCEVLVFKIYEFLERAVIFSSSIGIVVPHESQRVPFAKSLESRYEDVEVNTVNRFQGGEKDIIILYAFESKHFSDVESFISCKRRFNVALTRAKKCLIICLDSTLSLKYPHWKELLHDAQGRNLYFSVTSPKNVSSLLNSCLQKQSEI